MGIERHFLGWDRAGLVSAAEYMVEVYVCEGVVDMGDVVAVLPGGRAGRRLTELLVEGAEKRGVMLIPPRMLTIGVLGQMLAEGEGGECELAEAGNVARLLAWVDALSGMDGEVLKRLVPIVPEDDDWHEWAGLGELFDKLHRDVASQCLRFGDVAERGARLADFADEERWLVAGEVQRSYLARLKAMGLSDGQMNRLEAIEDGRCSIDKDVVLVGVVDMGSALRSMIEQVGDRVRTLVFAPKEMADRFDELGCVRVDAWSDVKIELEGELGEGCIEVVDGPGDQADAVMRGMYELGDEYCVEEVTVGVCDREVVPYLSQRMEVNGLIGRWAEGVELRRMGPMRLLGAAADYVERGLFSDLAGLMRISDVEDWMVGQKMLGDVDVDGEGGGEGEAADDIHVGVGDWLNLLDRYYTDSLQIRMSGKWLGEGETQVRLERLYDSVMKLLGGLNSSELKGLDEWAEEISGLLVRAYGGRELSLAKADERMIVEVCERIHGVLIELHGLGGDVRKMRASDAIGLVLHQLRDEMIPPEGGDGGIEMLGWLELVLDDAEVLLVTGLNEGCVPESFGSDLFLPNRLRELLGMEQSDSRRYARDAYALSAIVNSRAKVKLIAGRRRGNDEPLSPSRLLLTGSGNEIARRVQRFYKGAEGEVGDGDGSGVKVVVKGLHSGDRLGFEVPPKPARLREKIVSMSVTGFRDYLACPYRFYLRHVLKLKRLDDEAVELDAGAFGTLAHDVLAEFGKSEVAGSTDEGEIERFLRGALDGLFVKRYGDDFQSALLIQRESLYERLEAFAKWQARWAKEGWRIRHVEVDVGGEDAWLNVDGKRMYLRGRIDRVDVNEKSGRVVVFDYKTGDGGKSPGETHMKGGEWIDLQLPLYRHLVRALGIGGEIGLGYVVLPRAMEDVGAKMAGWNDDELAEADEVAREIVRGVWGEEFGYDPSAPLGWYDEFGAICGVGQFVSVFERDEGDENDVEGGVE